MCFVISLTCMDTHNSIRVESVHEEMRPGVFYYFPPPKKKNCSCKILRSQGSNGERERGEIVDGGWLPEERSRRSYLSVIRAIGFLLSLPSLPHPFLSLSCFEFPLVAILFEISRTQPPSNRTNETGGKKKGAGEIVSNKESRILRINRSNFGHSDRSSLQKNLAWSQSSSIPNIYWLIFLNLHVCLILFLNWKEFESTKIWFSGFRKIHRQLYYMLVRSVTTYHSVIYQSVEKKLGISKHDSLLKSWKRWSEDRRSN